jgi:hypothetical protein
MTASEAGQAGLPTPIDLGDGTLLLRDHGEIRLSGNRQRWWNGRMWVSVADSMPSNARLDAAREKWWDGVEWRPRRHTVPAWERRPILMGLAGSWLLFVLLGAVGVLPGLIAAILIIVVTLPGAYLTVTSKILRPLEKFLYLLSVVGIAILWVQSAMGGRRSAAAADGGAHLQA